jgi:hypothetical protein
VYADDSGQPAGDAAIYDLKGKIADALLQHAVALLMRLTTELRTLAELRVYAASLLAEVEQMYASDVQSGKAAQALQTGLKANVEYAGSIYANRVAFEAPAAAALFDEQIVTMIDEHRGKPFGKDLAQVAQRGFRMESSGRAAEAS